MKQSLKRDTEPLFAVLPAHLRVGPQLPYSCAVTCKPLSCSSSDPRIWGSRHLLKTTQHLGPLAARTAHPTLLLDPRRAASKHTMCWKHPLFICSTYSPARPTFCSLEIFLGLDPRISWGACVPSRLSSGRRDWSTGRYGDVYLICLLYQMRETQKRARIDLKNSVLLFQGGITSQGWVLLYSVNLFYLPLNSVE